MKRKVRRFRRKVSKRAMPVIKIWRVIVAIILFVIIAPMFLKTHENDNFYLIALSITAGLIALVFIVQRPLNRKLRRYLMTAQFSLMIAGGLLLAAAFVPDLTPMLKNILLIGSAAAYAFGAQRLGLGIFVGGL